MSGYYILANKKYGTLYVGVTNNLLRRIYAHKNNLVEGFTQKYQIHNLIYYEVTENVYAAITREKQIKKWNRSDKIVMIDRFNPEWKDLYPGLL